MRQHTHLKTNTTLRNQQTTTLTILLGAMLLSYACSSSEPVKAGLFSPPQSLSGTATPVAARSLSSMEAISRGVAAVTPPGAALKDVYYQFDSVDLDPEAQTILKKNAEWLKN